MSYPKHKTTRGSNMSQKVYAAVLAAGLSLPGLAFAGVDGSTGKINSAISSGSVDAIVSELERAENIPTTGAVSSVMKLIDHDSDRVREAAGWWLGRRAVRDQVVKMAELRLNAQDPTAARNVLDALRGMRDVSTLDLVGAYVAHPLDEQSGIAGLRTLGAIGSPKGLAMLTPALTNGMVGVRAQALRAVRELRAPVGERVVSTGAAYIPLLADADESVRREAALTLGFLGQRGLNTNADTSGVNGLINAVQNDTSARVRKACAWALGEIGSPLGRAALQKAITDSDPQVRSVATAASGRLN